MFGLRYVRRPVIVSVLVKQLFLKMNLTFLLSSLSFSFSPLSSTTRNKHMDQGGNYGHSSSLAHISRDKLQGVKCKKACSIVSRYAGISRSSLCLPLFVSLFLQFCNQATRLSPMVGPETPYIRTAVTSTYSIWKLGSGNYLMQACRQTRPH